MPSIASRTVPLSSVGYVPAEVARPMPSVPYSEGSAAPGLNVTLRCTLPPIFAATDNLRQFYRGGSVPQFRFLPAPALI